MLPLSRGSGPPRLVGEAGGEGRFGVGGIWDLGGLKSLSVDSKYLS